jgi:hypothetical protein
MKPPIGSKIISLKDWQISKYDVGTVNGSKSENDRGFRVDKDVCGIYYPFEYYGTWWLPCSPLTALLFTKETRDKN